MSVGAGAAVKARTWLDGPWYWVAVGFGVSLLLLVALMACASYGTTLPRALLRGYVLVAQVASAEAGAVLFWGAVLGGIGIARVRRRARARRAAA